MDRLIGVLGGTFDPPHLGHLILADIGRVEMELARVLWVVTTQSPFKLDDSISPIGHRVEMVQAAIKDDPGFTLSRADIERPEPHYAVGTMQWLAERHQGARFAYLMGADSLRNLPKWHMPRDFIQACGAIGVMNRSGVDVDMESLERSLPDITRKVHFFDAPLIGISGNDIRRRVKTGEAFRYLVPPDVAEIIIQYQLYK
jgi:nicotinate-nucleotide adenylyltransferase